MNINQKILQLEKELQELKEQVKVQKQAEDKIYYAKIKGWQLIPSDYCYFGLDDNLDLEIKDACDAYELTKMEWADLGCTDENADFEEVE